MVQSYIFFIWLAIKTQANIQFDDICYAEVVPTSLKVFLKCLILPPKTCYIYIPISTSNDYEIWYTEVVSGCQWVWFEEGNSGQL